MFQIEIQGLDKALKDLKKRGDDVPKMVHAVMKNGAEVIARTAIANCPVGTGKNAGALKASIEAVEVDYLDFDVEVRKFYAPYVEFGTGGFVQVPKGVEAYAMTFYVNGKGRMHPHPFLFPAYFKYRDQIVKDIKAQLNKPVGFKNP